MQKIIISASATFKKEILEWKEKLEQSGYEVVDYPEDIDGDFLSGYEKMTTMFYKHILQADAVLVLNFDKNGIDGYIGAGVFAEISFAMGVNLTGDQKIKIYLLNPIPQNVLNSDELGYWMKLGWIELWNEVANL